jgi:hypothetical protein
LQLLSCGSLVGEQGGQIGGETAKRQERKKRGSVKGWERRNMKKGARKDKRKREAYL